jgi:pyrroline-5-carboxylate reductase
MPNRVVLYDTNPEVSASPSSLHGAIEVSADAAGAAGQDVVFLAVHPPAIVDAVATIKECLRPDAILVSLAPKFTIAKLTGLLGGFERIARAIPNAPSLIGQGYNPVAFGAAFGPDDKTGVGELLSSLGECPEVDESHLEAYAILSAMGPTYFWPQLYELIAIGESFGLSRDAAHTAVDKMLWGTAATMKESGLSPEGVQDLIPVKPMADEVAALVSAYGAKLAGLMEMIKP